MSFTAFSADGHAVEWATWDDAHRETFTLTWENEAWTATGHVGREDVQYVMRLSATWHVRQFLLFRDLEEPDLWLALDTRHHWGEMNGAYRPDLHGCVDIELDCTPFTPAIPIRRLGLDRLGVGEAAELPIIEVDVETLSAVPVLVRYERVGESSWRRVSAGDGHVREFELDDHGLVAVEPGRFRRRRPAPGATR
jgi:hypothetical protein